MSLLLEGTTVVVTRARAQAGALARLLEDAGAEVLAFPTIEIANPESFEALDEAIRNLEVYDWLVLTSANAVERFFARLWDADMDAVGEGTRVLLPRALEAREVLPEELRAHGARVDVVPAYRTVPGTGDPGVLARLRAGDVDAVTFTSSSTVRNFVRLIGDLDLGSVIVACIGPVTGETARELGLTVSVEPEEYTVPALVEALGAYVSEA